MYALRNKVQLIGHVGETPVIRMTEKGKKYARLSVATNDSYRNANGDKVTKTYWHKVIAWGKLAEIAEKHIDKGKEIALEGKLTYREYVGKDGMKQNVTEVLVSDILLVGSKN